MSTPRATCSSILQFPCTGWTPSVNVALLAYLRTFSLWGRTTNVLVEQPYQWGTTRGILVDTPAEGSVSGFGDLGVTLTINLLGAPTMTPPEFQALRAEPHPILGASLKVVAPTGKYDPNRLLNVGGNRWGVKAELGSIIPLQPKVLLEIEGGAWFLGDDDEFIAGQREQEPIFGLEVHLVRRFKPGFWASLDANFFFGGRQTIAGRRARRCAAQLEDRRDGGGAVQRPPRRQAGLRHRRSSPSSAPTSTSSW